MYFYRLSTMRLSYKHNSRKRFAPGFAITHERLFVHPGLCILNHLKVAAQSGKRFIDQCFQVGILHTC